MTLSLSLSQILVEIDKTSDYLPISPVTNLVDLFQKYIIIPLIDRQTIENSHYYRHLERKESVRCLILLIPILGNIFIIFYDWKKREHTDPETVLSAITTDINCLKTADPELLDDEVFIAEAMRIDMKACQFASPRLKLHEDLFEDSLIEIVSKDALKLRECPVLSRDNPRIVAAAFQQNRASLNEVGILKSSQDFILSLLDETIDKPLLIAASKQLENIHEECLETLRALGFRKAGPLNQRVKEQEKRVFDQMEQAVNPLGELLRAIDPLLRTDAFYRKALQKFGDAIEPFTPVKHNRHCVMAALSNNQASLAEAPAFQDDKEVARYAFKCDPENALYFSKKLKEDRDFILELAAQNGMILFFAALQNWEGEPGKEKPVLLPGFRDDLLMALVAVRQNNEVSEWLSLRVQNDSGIRQILDDARRAKAGLPPRNLELCGISELPPGSTNKWFLELNLFLRENAFSKTWARKWLTVLGDVDSDHPKNPATLLKEKTGRETLWKLLGNTPLDQWPHFLETRWTICNLSILSQIKRAT